MGDDDDRAAVVRCELAKKLHHRQRGLGIERGEYGDPGISEIVIENLLDKIHADPRWLAFLRKIGKAPEQLAKIEFKVTLPVADSGTASESAHP